MWTIRSFMCGAFAAFAARTMLSSVDCLTKNPRVATLHRIALAFGMTLAEFLDFPELNEYAFDEDDE